VIVPTDAVARRPPARPDEWCCCNRALRALVWCCWSCRAAGAAWRGGERSGDTRQPFPGRPCPRIRDDDAGPATGIGRRPLIRTLGVSPRGDGSGAAAAACRRAPRGVVEGRRARTGHRRL